MDTHYAFIWWPNAHTHANASTDTHKNNTKKNECNNTHQRKTAYAFISHTGTHARPGITRTMINPTAFTGHTLTHTHMMRCAAHTRVLR